MHMIYKGNTPGKISEEAGQQGEEAKQGGDLGQKYSRGWPQTDTTGEFRKANYTSSRGVGLPHSMLSGH